MLLLPYTGRQGETLSCDIEVPAFRPSLLLRIRFVRLRICVDETLSALREPYIRCKQCRRESHTAILGVAHK